MKPSLEAVKKIAEEKKYKTVPISMEMLSDIRTPIEVLRILKNVSHHCYILESVADREKWGRYTFLGFDPKLEITCHNGEIKVGSLTFKDSNPDKYIRQVLSDYRSPKFDWLPSFTGGLVGYFSYDYLKYSEPTLRLDAPDTENFKDVDLMLFDKVIAFDNFRQKIILIVNISLDSPESEYNRAELELKNLAELIRNGTAAKEQRGVLKSDFKPIFDRELYCDMVKKAKHHIKEGDIFQIVLSNRLEADFEGSLLDTYRILRTV
ncbi:MAG: anthranilate synthase component I, partial [Oscillospiraceae bacterium]